MKQERDHHNYKYNHISSRGMVKEDVINETVPQKHFGPQLVCKWIKLTTRHSNANKTN